MRIVAALDKNILSTTATCMQFSHMANEHVFYMQLENWSITIFYPIRQWHMCSIL